ncbi:pentatricopeptide repeat-containing protein At1g61870, mitochondrial-like [Macadamia integrifolia]|uniref:pentatricopeptide repeat-containing protein At1g61870, mitochondrial-like n=1 Tax=Macadamia integrifolia TaxID=60698 RepID=UPI001C4E542B|nr:pentatricopeptide repeat-containing protein At1g61870, mitochondrial-like [Macadamia integrifolia]
MAAFCRNTGIHVSRRLLCTISSSASENPSTWTFRAAKSAIRHEPDPEKIADIFQNSSNFSRFRRDRHVFDFSVKKLTDLRRSDLIERILEFQKSPELKKSEGFWIRIIMLYSYSGMVDQAVRTFYEMGETGCSRTEKSLCALLSVFLDNRQFDRVHESFAEIPMEIGVSPGVKAYNLVLKAFCKQKSVESAHSLLHQMEEEKGVKPDIASYNILLGGYLRNGNELNFDEILNEICEKGLEPNLTTYNYRMERLCRTKECVRANELLDEMISKGIAPNLTSYNTVIDGFCNLGDFDSAKKVKESMCNSKSVLPNSDTFRSLIHHLVREGKYEEALMFCKESIRRKWIPPFVTMESLVNGLVGLSMVKNAKSIVKKMKKRLRGGAVDSWMKVEASLPPL